MSRKKKKVKFLMNPAMSTRKAKPIESENAYRSLNVSTEKIHNGYLSHISGDHPDGYKRITRFHRTDPMGHKGGQIARIMSNLKKMHEQAC